MALTAAFLGWMFDGVEIGLFPLVARPSLRDLLGSGASEGQIGLWIAAITAGFLVGAATGGVIFGWLGDRVGRVRALTLSVLTYALFSGACGLATSAEQVFFYRFVAALGMGGEWSLGVSLVMEIWPNRSRALLAGLIGAAANVGFLMIAVASLGLAEGLDWIGATLHQTALPTRWVDALTAHDGWRLLMLMAASPALLTFFIRIFVPESERWLHAQSKGHTSHWAARDLIGVVIGAAAALATVYIWSQPLHVSVKWLGTLVGLGIALVGYTYPVRRYLGRTVEASAVPGSAREANLSVTSLHSRTIMGRMIMGACLSGVALLGTWGSLQWAPAWADQLTGGEMPNAKAYTQILSGIGAIIGTMLAALLADRFGRRSTYALLCAGSLASALVFFLGNTTFGPAFLVSVLVAGGLTASFYGWLPLYLPELFPTAVRATGQGFAYNFGRVLAAIGVLQTGYLMDELFNGSYPKACSTMSLIYVVGIIIIWFVPETKGCELPE